MRNYPRFFFISYGVTSILVFLFLVSLPSGAWMRIQTQILAQEDKKEDIKVDVIASAKHSRAGKQAFDRKDYLLAKNECEAALSLNPDNVNAQEIQKETQDALDALNESIRETVSLFKSKQNNEAFEKLQNVKESCVNYPAADALFKKAVQVLVDEGWEAYGGDNVNLALTKAEEALELVPNDSSALELLKECEEKPIRTSGSDSDSNPFLEKKAGTRATLKYNGVEFAFRYCPPSRYTKAKSWNKSGRYAPKGFWIGETEVSQAQWEAVGLKKNYKSRFIGEKFPVETVTWYESVAFVRILNERRLAPKGWHFELPTEQQWEYACFAGTSGTDYLDFLKDYGWYKANSEAKVHDVGTKKPNEWGVYDMLGNVSEWTNSRYNGDLVVNRGGSWEEEASGCNFTKRRVASKDGYYHCVGFRLILVRNY